MPVILGVTPYNWPSGNMKWPFMYLVQPSAQRYIENGFGGGSGIKKRALAETLKIVRSN
jgi:hypothetical protein